MKKSKAAQKAQRTLPLGLRAISSNAVWLFLSHKKQSRRAGEFLSPCPSGLKFSAVSLINPLSVL